MSPDPSTPSDVYLLSKRVSLLEAQMATLISMFRVDDPPALVREEDLSIDTTAQAVPGGSWAMKMRHLPTGIMLVATSSQYKSQLQARAALIIRLEAELQRRGWTP